MSDDFNNFESAIKNYSARKLSLYNDRKLIEISNSPKPAHVVANISKQIKTINEADSVDKKTVARNTLNYRKHTGFLPVNMLDVSQQMSNSIPDTQCVFDTQILNLIDDVESLANVQAGVTQEFETSFEQKFDKNVLIIPGDDDNEKNGKMDHLKTQPSQPAKDINASSQSYFRNKDLYQLHDTGTLYKLSQDNYHNSKITDMSTVDMKETKLLLLSPELKSNTKTKETKKCSLTYKLDSFEKFEAIAVPIVKDNTNFEEVKRIISSQIQFSLLSQDDPKSSCPNKDINKLGYLKDSDKYNDKDKSTCINTLIEDTNLFSSDEETDYILNNSKDMPLTCALETSFYKQTEVLDKTMYVGFQTASNRSIQVLTDSFSFAKSLFNGDNQTPDHNTKNLTELVKAYDSALHEKENDYTNVAIEPTNNESDFNVNNTAGFVTASIISIPETESCTNVTNNVSEVENDNVSLVTINKNNSSGETKSKYCHSIEEKDNKNINWNTQEQMKINTCIAQDFEEYLLHLDDKKIHTNFDNGCGETKTKNDIEKSEILLVGFKTAGNKNIEVSKHALAKTEIIFKDIENLDIPIDASFNEEFCSTKNDKILQESISVSLPKNNICHKNTLSSCLNFSTDINKDKLLRNNTQNMDENHSHKFFGFQKANKKPINITEDALAKSNIIFLETNSNNIVMDEVSIENKQKHIYSKNKTTLGGFKIPYSKPLKNSTQTLINPKRISGAYDINPRTKNYGLSEIVKLNVIQDSIIFSSKGRGHVPKRNCDAEQDSSKNILPLFSGFRKANNKPIEITKEALAKSTKILQDMDIISDAVQVGIVPGGCPSFPQLTWPKVVSNKPVTMPEHLLDGSKIIFSDVYDNNVTDKKSSFTGIEKLNLFKDCGESSRERTKQSTIIRETENQNLSNNNFSGFRKANNKPIPISKEAFAKSDNIFQDFNMTSNWNEKDIEQAIVLNDDRNKNIVDVHNSSSSVFIGFKTASNKPVNISDEALAKTSRIFDNIRNNCGNFEREDEYNVLNKSRIKSFERHDKLIKDEMMVNKFSSNRNKTFKIQEEEESAKENLNLCYRGFRTGNNKNVKVSEDAFLKSKKIFENLDIHSEDFPKLGIASPLNKINDNSDIKESNIIQKGKTFPKKNVLGSANIDDMFNTEMVENFEETMYTKDFVNDSLVSQRSRSPILSSGPVRKHLSFKRGSETADVNTTNPSTFYGFRNANEKPITISKKALANSSKILNDIDLESDWCGENITENNVYEEKRMLFEATKMTSNNLKTISDNSKTLQRDIKNANVSNENNNYPNKDKFDTTELTSSRVGFKTANNKPVQISEKALAKSRSIFYDIRDDEKHHFETLEASNSALNKDETEVGLSSKSAEKASTEFNLPFVNINTNKISVSPKLFDVPTIKPLKADFVGFKTANNKNVNVSDEALLKSRKIFESVDINSRFDHPKQTIGSKDSSNIVRDSVSKNSNVSVNKCNSIKDLENDKNAINTEIAINFEQTLNTEDFLKESPATKRSGSPILSCRKAKKRKNSINNKISMVDSKIIPPYTFQNTYKEKKIYNLQHIQAIENQFEKYNSTQEMKYNLENVENFVFDKMHNEITNCRWTTNDLKSYFIDSVNKNIIPDGWVSNHLKLIILKLIFYEGKFPNVLGSVCTVVNVLEQLKYRYKRELYNVERPALRKILEKDEVANKSIVLKVLGIYVDDINVTCATNVQNNIELLLSDGWYCVKANIDKMLCKLVCDSKILIGTKLIIHGAELMNCEQGVAPWEDTSAVRLKIFGNSTRRADWKARLGFHGNAAILSHLATVKPDGGKVSQLRVFVTRVYPMLFVEKFEDGSTVTRSERLENLHQMKYEMEREVQLEKIYEEVQQEFSNLESQDFESADSENRNMECGSQIWRLMRKSKDPAEFRANLSHSQAQHLQEYAIRRRDNTLQEIQGRVQERLKSGGLDQTRNVIPMLKVRVADVYNGETTKALVTIWKPNERLLDVVKEGAWVDLYNVAPTGVRYSEIQISAGRQSLFRNSTKVNDAKAKITKKLQRRCYCISELTQNPFTTTDYNEIDTVGFVFEIEPSLEMFDINKQLFQNVYIADADKRILCINFWGGIKKFGFENTFDIGQIVTCVNLQKRSGNTKKNIPQYRATELSYFTKTSKIDAIRKTYDDLSKTFTSLDRRKFIEDCVAIRNNFVNMKYNIENISPYRFNNSDNNISKNKAFIDSPIGDLNLNLTGLDFESTFKQTDTQLSPNSLRKKKVNERIAKLKKYGEPPPLSAIHILNKSKDAIKPYKSPLISKMECDAPRHLTDSTPIKTLDLNSNNPTDAGVAKDLPESSQRLCTSPVLPFKGRIRNPIKLNFNKHNDESKKDLFSQDFDISPPLSLD